MEQTTIPTQGTTITIKEEITQESNLDNSK